MRTLESPELRRNMGFWNEATQQAILDTEVAIAGNGGTGNLLGMELARIGIQRFKIADPEVFDDVNSNRVMGARIDTIGRNKAEVLKEDILKINPEAEVDVYTDGITPENIGEFLHGADVALNGTELTMPELGTMLAREARTRHIKGEHDPLPVLDVEYIAHAGQGTSFDPYSKMTFERFMGMKDPEKKRKPEELPLDVVAELKLDPSRYLVYLPTYGDLHTLDAVRHGSPLPSNMIGAGVAAQIGVSEVLKHVRAKAGEKGMRPVFAPNVRWMDAYTNESGIARQPQFSYYRHLAKIAVSNILHTNEQGSYSAEDRARRGDIA